MTVSIPQPVKKCETKSINLPSVSCEEEKEERCFTVVSLDEKMQEIEKCVTSLGKPKCNKISLELPAQRCEEELKEYKKKPQYEH